MSNATMMMYDTSLNGTMYDTSLNTTTTTTTTTSNETTTVALLNDAQEISLAVLSVVSALLSIVGSSLILRLILRPSQSSSSNNNNATTGRTSNNNNNSGRKVLDNTYDRLLFGMSIADLLMSLTQLCFPFLVPASTSRRIWAMGTYGTCQAMATTYTWATSSFWYSACLSFYFLLLLRKQVPGRTVATKYEPWMHILSIGWPFLFGIAGIFLGVYHELRMGPGCSVVGAPIFGYLALALPLLLGMISITVNNILIVSYVRRTTQNSKRWMASSVFSSALTSASLSRPSQPGLSTAVVVNNSGINHSSLEQQNSRAFSASDSSVTFTTPSCTTIGFGNLREASAEQQPPVPRSSSSLRRSSLRFSFVSSLPLSLQGSATSSSPSEAKFKMVAAQSVLYVVSIYAVYLWPLARAIAGTTGVRSEQDVYWLLVLQSMLLPLQGFWTCLIYCRPRYLSRRNRFARIESRWMSLRCVVLGISSTNNHNSSAQKKSDHTRSNATNEVSLPVGNNNDDDADEDGNLDPLEDDCEVPLPSKEDYHCMQGGKAQMSASSDDDQLSSNEADQSVDQICEDAAPCGLKGESQGLGTTGDTDLADHSYKVGEEGEGEPQCVAFDMMTKNDPMIEEMEGINQTCQDTAPCGLKGESLELGSSNTGDTGEEEGEEESPKAFLYSDQE